MRLLLFIFVVKILSINGLNAQPPKEMSFEDYDPPSTLKVKESIVKRAKFPFIDIHNHIFDMNKFDFETTIIEMDSLNMILFNNLSGRGIKIDRISDSIVEIGVLQPDYFLNSKPIKDKEIAKRFIVFTNIDFENFDDKDWSEKTVKQLVSDVNSGAKGLKIYKDLGLTLKDKNGKRIPVNHPKIDPIWDKCGELGIPVLIHSGEPASFFDSHDETNERWLELKLFPSRARPPHRFPSWEKVMKEQHSVFKKHSNTIFINAHMGWMANDLKRLAALLDNLPNMYVEISAAIAELGRQPHTAREFFINYQDRILFGKDTYKPEEYHTYFRILETNDEYFKYFRRRHAFWRMYGLNLPDKVLKKVYYSNSAKILKI